MRHDRQIFHNPPLATPADVRLRMDRGDISGTLDVMVGAVLYGGGDWERLQELYLLLLGHEDRQVSALAATCLGHVARVYRRVDERRVVAALRKARSVPHMRGTVTNALDDIETFLHPRRTRWRAWLWRAMRPGTWG